MRSSELTKEPGAEGGKSLLISPSVEFRGCAVCAECGERFCLDVAAEEEEKGVVDADWPMACRAAADPVTGWAFFIKPSGPFSFLRAQLATLAVEEVNPEAVSNLYCAEEELFSTGPAAIGSPS